MNTCGANLIEARIATFGERTEDYFYITDSAGKPFTDTHQQDRLREAIVDALG